MTTNARGGWLLVKFGEDRMKRWELPDRSKKEEIRRIRDEAVDFARVEEATLGQINAIKKALTDAGYYLKGPRDKTLDPRA